MATLPCTCHAVPQVIDLQTCGCRKHWEFSGPQAAPAALPCSEALLCAGTRPLAPAPSQQPADHALLNPVTYISCHTQIYILLCVSLARTAYCVRVPQGSWLGQARAPAHSAAHVTVTTIGLAE